MLLGRLSPGAVPYAHAYQQASRDQTGCLVACGLELRALEGPAERK